MCAVLISISLVFYFFKEIGHLREKMMVIGGRAQGHDGKTAQPDNDTTAKYRIPPKIIFCMVSVT